MCKYDPATGGVCSPADGTHSAALFEQFKTHPLWHVDLSSSVSLSLPPSPTTRSFVSLTHTNTPSRCPSHSLLHSLALNKQLFDGCKTILAVSSVCVCVRDRH